jgi:hypothetical protein
MIRDHEKAMIWRTTFTIYEGISVLVHEGLIDIRFVARMLGRYRFDWEK